jgi:hypothetical protein
MIDWQSFTPITSLIGGLLIGSAAGLLIVLVGRVAGISGIVGGLLSPKSKDVLWRLSFVAGILSAFWVYRFFAVPMPIQIEASPITLALAGLLVGIGTRYGAGCTSGHGVCGLSRFSLRSLMATAVFMAAGFVTVFIVRHLLFQG